MPVEKLLAGPRTPGGRQKMKTGRNTSSVEYNAALSTGHMRVGSVGSERGQPSTEGPAHFITDKTLLLPESGTCGG